MFNYIVQLMNFVQNVVIVQTTLLYGEVASQNLILYRFGENVQTSQDYLEN